jgi:protein-S-isoprenylcysteine O-methyltransferase Ste14
MSPEEILIRKAAVLASALVYWGGVLIQARRVKRHIGRAPNVAPRGTKERVLWLGWMIVVFGWLAMPFLASLNASLLAFQLHEAFLQAATLIGGILLSVAGYAGTLWCYSAMGDHWRMGIDHENASKLIQNGPYRSMRHPIYSFQILMLAGSALLLPTWMAVGLLVLHCTCVLIKALDEEAFLTRQHGATYKAYMMQTGRLLPRLRPGPSPE